MATTIRKKKNKWYVIFEGSKPGIYSSWDECLQGLGHFGGRTKFKAYLNADEAWTNYRKYFESKTVPVEDKKPPLRPTETISLSSFYTQRENLAPPSVIKLPVVTTGLTSIALVNPQEKKIIKEEPSKEEKKDFTQPPTKKVKKEKIEPWIYGQQYPSLVVDAACNNPSGGIVEYRCCRIQENKKVVPVFSYGPFNGGSNNIGEYIALVKALEWLKSGHYDSSESYISMVYSDSSVALKWVTGGGGCNTTLDPDIICPELKTEIKLCDKLVKDPEFLTFAQKMCKKWLTEEWGEIPADYGRK